MKQKIKTAMSVAFGLGMCVPIYAVKVQDVFKVGTVWEQTLFIDGVATPSGNNQEIKEYYELTGSFEIDGKQCMKMVVKTDGDIENKPDGIIDDVRDFCYIHTEGEMVWFHRMAKDPEWLLMYDFGLDVDAECQVYDARQIDNEQNSTYPAYAKNIGVDNESECGVHDVMLLRQHFIYDGDSGHSVMEYKWIYGIGGIDGVMANVSYQYMVGDGGSRLDKVTTTEGVVLDIKAGGVNILEEMFGENEKYYDLGGIPVEKPQSGKIYVKNGQKVIFK